MNKFKSLFIILAVLIMAEGIGILYVSYKNRALSKTLLIAKPEIKRYTELVKECEAVKQDRKDINTKYEAAIEDRTNLTSQIKRLMQEQAVAKEMEEAFEKLKKEKSELDIVKAETDAKNSLLKKENDELTVAQEKLEQELDKVNTLYKDLKSSKTMTGLHRQISDLQRENKSLKNNSNKVNKETEKLKKELAKATETKNGLTLKIKDFEKKYADAVDKNKRLEKEMGDMPQKFSELARQNKLLISETAKMHYNLGVFYTKNKEYPRAAAEFQKAIEIDPNDAYAHFNLGYLYAEYIVNRDKAVREFRQYLSLAKNDDADIDWARKYILTWEAYNGKEPMK